MADVCGPFTLEDLDQFGTIDSIAFSLDSDIWTSAETCILSGAGDVSGDAASSALGGYLLEADASITGTGTAESGSVLTQNGAGTATGEGSVAALGGFAINGAGAINGTGSADATAGLEINATADIFGTGFADASAQADYQTTGYLFGYGTQVCVGYVIGEEWADIPAGVNVWAVVPEGSNTWLRNG